jgi:glutaconate CoA-transferase subunit A
VRLELGEAIDRFAPDGATVYIGNFGAQLFAVGHVLIRRGRCGLHLVVGSGGILMDQLLGAGVLARATFAHCWSPVGPAPAWNFRRACERGSDVRFDEVTLGVLASALRAGAWGVPFMPTTDLAGTVYAEPLAAAGLVATASSPFGDVEVARALAPDVAFVHVDAVDPDLNGIMRGSHGESVLAAEAARAVVLVTGKLVDEPDPAACAIPGALTSAVVVEPFALHPDSAAGDGPRDVAFYDAYARAAATEDGFRRWLDDWVLEPRSRAAYRTRLEAAT